MDENITFIKDPTVHIKPSEQLVKFLQDHFKNFKNQNEVPKNLKNVIKNKKNLINGSDLEWLHNFLSQERNKDDCDLLKGSELDEEVERILQDENLDFDYEGFFEEKNKNHSYLHELMKGSELILPKNEVVERNPVLAERVERLKKEQEEREYKAMTQNVDTTKKFIAEDTISYQVNMMNRHLIAVGQFLLSVGAGFAFGFLGIELAVGGLGFGVRLLLGISCALVIALAEFYFLAKHLNEEDKEGTKQRPTTSKPTVRGKLHKD